ncbi:MAG TPA: hypothetical protein VIM14_08925, partial [Polyangia bacterium]
RVVDREERYLRQMEQCADSSTPGGAAIASLPVPEKSLSRRLSVFAVAIAATALLLALGLVLALAIAG